MSVVVQALDIDVAFNSSTIPQGRRGDFDRSPPIEARQGAGEQQTRPSDHEDQGKRVNRKLERLEAVDISAHRSIRLSVNSGKGRERRGYMLSGPQRQLFAPQSLLLGGGRFCTHS